MSARVDYLVSVHDVMPETLGRVLALLERLDAAALGPATLLVVPGRDWRGEDLAVLERLAAAGHRLAGHGVSHRATRYRNLAHRVHGLLMSRHAAEHLAHDAAGIRRLIGECRDWFERHALPAPSLYVPPAWAMGPLPRQELRGLGFRYYEYLTGIYDARRDAWHRIPVLGFEADTAVRALSLRFSNAVNRLIARRLGVARLALHPYDLELKLADDLHRCLDDSGGATTSVEALATSS